MIDADRLKEIELSPRDACLFKAEAKELADAYRNAIPGLRVTKGTDGAWLHIESPSGRKAAISLEVLGIQRGGLVGEILLEWVDALEPRAILDSARAAQGSRDEGWTNLTKE